MGKRCIEIANHILIEDATVREAANKSEIAHRGGQSTKENWKDFECIDKTTLKVLHELLGSWKDVAEKLGISERTIYRTKNDN